MFAIVPIQIGGKHFVERWSTLQPSHERVKRTPIPLVRRPSGSRRAFHGIATPSDARLPCISNARMVVLAVSEAGRTLARLRPMGKRWERLST